MQLPFLLACIVLSGGHCFSEAPPNPVRHEPMILSIQYRYDPCTDGRLSDGRPRSCAELRQALRRDRWRDWPDDTHRRSRRHYVNPCTDGRFSDGRARSCRELLDWLDRQ